MGSTTFLKLLFSFGKEKKENYEMPKINILIV